MICDVCGLPDPYRGQGDGIGSCDCPRCDCGAAQPHIATYAEMLGRPPIRLTRRPDTTVEPVTRPAVIAVEPHTDPGADASTPHGSMAASAHPAPWWVRILRARP